MMPNGTRFIGIAPGVDLKERKSDKRKNRRNVFV